MQVSSNWAIFIEEKEIKWAFGDPDKEFLIFVTNFISGLSNIGEEILGQHGIASIIFDLKKRSGFNTAEIFIISLMNKFFLLMTDPLVTMKLIDASGGIAYEVQEIMSAVLVGQAAVLYAQCITDVSPETQNKLEHLWRSLILDISDKYIDNIDTILSSGGSNFSMMSFEDLIFLHYYLRQQPELAQPLSPKGWVLCSSMSGGELPFTYNVTSRDPVVLAGYLGIIIAFLITMFESKPKKLIFGTNTISSLSFINGEDYFIAIDGLFTQLANDPDFFQEFFSIAKNIQNDLNDGLRKRIIEEIIDYKVSELELMDIEVLLKNYKIPHRQISESREETRFKRRIRQVLGRL